MSQQMIDWTKGDQPSTAAVAAVAEVTDRDIRELSPLQSTLDVDALDTLIIRGVANSDADVQASFRHEGIQASVETDG